MALDPLCLDDEVLAGHEVGELERTRGLVAGLLVELERKLLAVDEVLVR
jgi:hypothetical protein